MRWAALTWVATEQSASRLCSVCFDGKYPIELPRQTALGKNVMQGTLANAARTGANPASVMQSENDNVPTLRRP
jgi:amidophosphoribosyltransferase